MFRSRPRPGRLRERPQRRAPRDAPHRHLAARARRRGELPVEVALQWTDAAEERIYSFCNVVNTVDGGTHVSGLRRALTRCLNNQAYETGRLKRDKGESLEARDVFDGLTAAVSVMVVDPQFEGQTKGRLNSSEAQSAVQSFVNEGFSAWLAANPRETEAGARPAAPDARHPDRPVQDLEEAPERGDVDLLRLEPPGEARRHARQPERAGAGARAVHRRGRLRRRLREAGPRRRTCRRSCRSAGRS